MAINKIELLDLDDNPVDPEAFKDPEVIKLFAEVGGHRTAHILEQRIHNYLTPEDALIIAYLQGRFDVEMEDQQAEEEAPKTKTAAKKSKAQVIKPKGIKSKGAFGSDPKKVH